MNFESSSSSFPNNIVNAEFSGSQIRQISGQGSPHRPRHGCPHFERRLHCYIKC